MVEIHNGSDVIDSRDIIAKIEELESLEFDADGEATADFSEDDIAELETLRALASECEGYGDWPHGEALIRDTYFEEYAQQLAEDIGAINSDATWPNNCIDWEHATNELKHDYMSVEYDGVEYWMRA